MPPQVDSDPFVDDLFALIQKHGINHLVAVYSPDGRTMSIRGLATDAAGKVITEVEARLIREALVAGKEKIAAAVKATVEGPQKCGPTKTAGP